ncbi:MAG: helix-turn-helix domain-containing protein [Clostridiales bacterium]|nr:helix-turn-helix domain-containing protein [Clostridiales bacterium]
MSIGENIKKLRKERNLTQQELGDKVGVTQAMIGQIERGSKTPTMVLGKDIAEAFEVDVAELYK